MYTLLPNKKWVLLAVDLPSFDYVPLYFVTQTYETELSIVKPKLEAQASDEERHV